MEKRILTKIKMQKSSDENKDKEIDKLKRKLVYSSNLEEFKGIETTAKQKHSPLIERMIGISKLKDQKKIKEIIENEDWLDY